VTPFSATFSVAVAQWLGADFTPTHYGVSPMLRACGEEHWNDKIELLLELGADLNESDMFGTTPMMELCKLGNLTAAKLLHAHGADIHRRNEYGENALFFACSGGHLPAMRWLVEQGAIQGPSVVNMLLNPLVLKHIAPAHWLVLQGAGFDRANLPSIKRLLVETLKQHTGLLHLLSGTRSTRGVKRARRACVLPMLQGHELVLSLVADFAGVARGRELRRAREALL
jgi:hypothetical protein